MAPIIDIVRHAEGRNNTEGHAMPDPELTDKGVEQAERLRATYPHGDKVKWLVASPLRRTIYTARIGIRPLVRSGEMPILLMPELQENSARPSDTGTPLSELKLEFATGGSSLSPSMVISTRMMEEDGGEEWFAKATPDSAWWPSLAKVEERARTARNLFRTLARDLTGPDERIVVITHGAFAHFLTEDFAGLKPNAGSGVWGNAEVRSYRFRDLHAGADDEDAALEEVDPLPGRDWSALTDEEKARQKSYAVHRLKRHEDAAWQAFNNISSRS
ncbi:histidine phosphatase superfamily [Xylariaceae sp. FL0594]|nr:histidine phosphatase superfamily [Xylariaceae sp. FL0594]